jgi:hypothetical protein
MKIVTSVYSLRKNFSYTQLALIITFGVIGIIVVFSYFYFRLKYHIHVYD